MPLAQCGWAAQGVETANTQRAWWLSSRVQTDGRGRKLNTRNRAHRMGRVKETYGRKLPDSVRTRPVCLYGTVASHHQKCVS